MEDSLEAKETLFISQLKEIEQLSNSHGTFNEQLQTLQQRISELEGERDSLVRQQAAASESHTKMIRSLREEFMIREQQLEAEKAMFANSRTQLYSREAQMEAGSLEHSQALAAAQRTIEEKSSQLSELQSAKRWLEADLHAVQEELRTTKSALALETEQLMKMQEEVRGVARDASHREATLQAEVSFLQVRVQDLNREMAELQTRLQIQMHTAQNQERGELEKKLSSMADHLLQKQIHIEKLVSEKAAIKLQLDNERKLSQMLKQQLSQLQEADDADDTDADFTSIDIHGGSTPGSGKLRARARAAPPAPAPQASSSSSLHPLRSLRDSPPVQQALSFLDSLGAQFGQLLRARPRMRVAFMIYILLIHLWVMFIFSHFMNHVPHSVTPVKKS
eukprot:TRINITY_DN11872_c0_g1_i8.p1 TRINITY_DN11872_c0_g1~~TRINITY_DN11872_c0_g1_i8.p1  ORF type:complete len:416 (+),score=91.81 TRINITY_DN11872_c0_g1_i8:71-1249(+)